MVWLFQGAARFVGVLVFCQASDTWCGCYQGRFPFSPKIGNSVRTARKKRFEVVLRFRIFQPFHCFIVLGIAAHLWGAGLLVWRWDGMGSHRASGSP